MEEGVGVGGCWVPTHRGHAPLPALFPSTTPRNSSAPSIWVSSDPAPQPVQQHRGLDRPAVVY